MRPQDIDFCQKCKLHSDDCVCEAKPASFGNSELLPCPFCGNPPVTMPCGDGDKAEMIECLSDGCVGPHISYYGQGVARKIWNTRARLAEIEGQSYADAPPPDSFMHVSRYGIVATQGGRVITQREMQKAPSVPEGWQFHGPLKALVWACKNNTGAEPSVSCYERALSQAEHTLLLVPGPAATKEGGE